MLRRHKATTHGFLLLIGALVWHSGAPQSAALENTSSHWAFRSVSRPLVPSVSDRSWLFTPIDAFVLSRLEKEGISATALADRPTLLRRVCLDLIGLPPTPEEQAAFVNDSSPAAYVKVVDRLLSRSEYGQRWARHWLDVARYAESNGYERDGTKPSAWRYRDYVIDSFNRDKPFDQFLKEQLAGDEIENANAETQIATTFLRLGTWDDEPADPLVDRYDQLDDVLGTTATAFLGLTLRCARCHDHKFEPFSQQDYYGMLAVFEPLIRPQIGREDLDWPVGTEVELAAHRRAQLELAGARFGAGTLRVAGGVFQTVSLLGPFEASQPKQPPRAYVWYETASKPAVTRLFRRGDPTKGKEVVPPAIPEILANKKLDPPRPTSKSSGRRLWLAKWMTQAENPLVARVIVNRVWQHHFGEGLVPSENDFGEAGRRPSHPELLDWLASEFVAGGWRLKPLHRLIVLSHVYQLAGRNRGAAGEADTAILSHWRPRRLDAEVVRDSILAVSGRLNLHMGGPSIYPPIPHAVLQGQSRPGDGWGKSDARQAARRSIYIFAKRSVAPPELELLDAPDTTSSCEQRAVSTTGPQALTFLNGEFIQEQAKHLAGRIHRDAGPDAQEQIRRAFELALCRPPSAEETQTVCDFLARHRRLLEAECGKNKLADAVLTRKALEAFCLTLLNTNEFAYVH